MIIIVNEKYHHLAANVDRVEYKTLCKIAGKDPLKNHTVTIKNKFGCFDIKDNQQVFCTDRMIVTVIEDSTELEKLKERYIVDCKWRDAWLEKSRKPEYGRLCITQEYIDKRARYANFRISVILEKINNCLKQSHA